MDVINTSEQIINVNVVEQVIDVNVVEEVITIEAPTGGYPTPSTVYSVFGRTGSVVAQAGDYNTSQVTESGNLYFTNARARGAISLTTTGTSGAATYSTVTGVLNIPQYQGGVTSFNTRTGAITLTSGDVTTALGFTPYNATNPSAFIALTALSAGTGISYNNTTGVISSTITQYTDALARAAITLTTTGTSGAATYNSTTGILNIPQYIGGVTSVFGRTGAVVAASGDYTTTQVTEGTNLYYTDVRARAALSFVAGSGAYNSTTGVITIPTNTNQLTNGSNFITLISLSSSATGLTYTNTTGVFSLTAGYSIPTTAIQGNWTTAYNDSITSAAVTGTTTKTLTLNQQDGGTITATWTDINSDVVTSVFGRTGAIVAVSGDYNTDLVTEGTTNIYFTNSRARLALSAGTGISYNNTTGVITSTITQYTDALARAALSFVAGSGAYNSTTGVITIPTNNNQLTNGSNFITLTSLSAGTGISYNNTTGVITSTITQYTDALARAAITLTTTGTSGASTYNNTTGVLNIPQYNGMIYPGAGIAVSTGTAWGTSITDNSSNWNTAYTNRITSLTVTGSSGSATLVSNTLNIPTYTLAGLGGVPTSRTLTINGVTYDLSADRSWTVSGGGGGTIVNARTEYEYTTDGSTATYTAAYTVGQVDVFYNGSKLSATEFTATNGTSVTLNFTPPIGQLVEVVAWLGMSAVPSTRTLTINGVTYDLSADRSWTVSGVGGGSSVSYYLNGSVNQGTIGGVTYYEMNKVPVIGAGTDFSRGTNGYIASFLTDANDPALLEIPAGNWNFETYFNASNGGGSPNFYIELYKYDGTTFTLIASNSATPKLINDGASIEAYFSALAVPQTTLTLTDRLAVRIYVNTSGRTISLHTENGHLCQVITTFTTGLTALNGLTAQVQYFGTGTSGTDFNIASSVATHTFNLPIASASNTGKLSSSDWSVFNNKQTALSGTGFVKISGTTISYDNSTYYLASNPSAFIALTDLSAGTGINYNNTTGVITNSAPDQTVSLTASTGISVSGTYPSFTIASTITQYTDALARASISLTTTGTSGAATYDNTTGVLNIPQYSGGGGGGMAIGGSITSATAGSVLFAGAAGVLAQDNANFFWDDTNDRLNIGSSTTGYFSSSLFVSQKSTNYAFEIKTTSAKTSTTLNKFMALSSSDATSPQYLEIGIVGNATIGSRYFSFQTSEFLVADGGNIVFQPRGGNVGIGATTIGSKLQVNGNAAIGYSASTAAPTNGLLASGQIRTATNFQANDGTRDIYINPAADFGNGSLPTIQVVSNHNLQFATNNSLRATLNTSGNFGLGTATIGSKLQVNGNAAIGYSASTAAPTNGLAVAGDTTIAGVLMETITTNRQTASYTLVLADRGKLVEMNVATANNLTIPLNSSVAFPIGTQIDISQYGAGQTTVVATGGVTIRSTNSWVKLNAQYAAATLIKIGTDEWYLFGNLNA